MHTVQPPRMMITWDVLERALAAGDDFVVAACRRVIRANHIGRRKHGNPADMQVILAFA